ncbi:HK97 gp10 family phage protein [Kineococcus gynurae]|uniref:HK97 gp10 family phage protein n=1 Tax=Kineococcus gynurae TaxID=452979 RepID=A0ABV5LX68_9ACTN
MSSSIEGRLQVAGLADALRRTPEELRTEIRQALRQAATPILADARRRASWSRRIPGAISTRVSFTGKNAGVRLQVDATRAPHGRPYEGIVARGQRKGFRHPVYAEGGHRAQWKWVTSPYRPFLAPAVQAASAATETRLLEAVDGVLRRRGF